MYIYVKKRLEDLLKQSAQSYLNNASTFSPTKEPRLKVVKRSQVEMGAFKCLTKLQR
jgi:hypothetical protein